MILIMCSTYLTTVLIGSTSHTCVGVEEKRVVKSLRHTVLSKTHFSAHT